MTESPLQLGMFCFPIQLHHIGIAIARTTFTDGHPKRFVPSATREPSLTRIL